MNQIIVYTKNNCQACRMTKLHLTDLGIKFDERNVETNDFYMVDAIRTGYTSMPIVVVDGRVIASGFQPDKLNALEGSN